MVRVALELAPHFIMDVRQMFFPKRYRCNQGMVSLINHASVRGVSCRADPRSPAAMNIHCSGSQQVLGRAQCCEVRAHGLDKPRV